MDNLISGTPQKVQSGAILLGLSAWHLYPDISVLSGSSNVILQRDPLIAPLGVLTISHEICTSDKKVTWSLPLAYMKYYGEPQNFCRTLGQDNTRISMDQFGFVILGCVIATWKSFARTPKIGLGCMLDVVNAWRGLHLGSGDDARSVSSPSSCVSTLFRAAEAFEVATQDEQDFAMKLVRLGIQQKQFLCALAEHPPPVFGLSEFSTVFPLMKGQEERINCLRQIGKFLNLEADIYVIRYHVLQNNGLLMYEYATLTPLAKQTSKRTHDGNLKFSTSLGGQHVRWFPIVTSVCKAEEHQRVQKKCSRCYGSRHRRANDIENDTNFTRICHDLDKFDYNKCSGYNSTFEARRMELEACGAICIPVHQYLYDDSPEHDEDYRLGTNFNPSRERKSLFDFGIGSSFNTALHTLVTNNSDHLKDSPGSCELQYHSGDLATAAIFRLETNPWRKQRHQGGRAPVSMKSLNPIGNYIIPDCFKIVMDPKNFQASALIQWLRMISSIRSTTFVDNDTSEEDTMNKAAIVRAKGYPAYTKALKAVASAADIYKLLPDATVSTLIVQLQTLDKALWIPQQDENSLSLQLSRADAFACIASFESGTCNLSPASLGEVFAMSCGNSIFVAGPLLCDPFEVPTNTEIRRVVGNVGRPGISLLIAPPIPRVVTPPGDNWLQINNRPFDGKIENCFKDTSIHISFTAYELPLDSVDNTQGRVNVIDRPASLVETLVSVYDKEVWIADLNILQSLQSSLLRRFECVGPGIGGKVPNCIHGVARKSHATYAEVIEYDGHSSVTVENWWELLQTPDKIPKVVNSHNNWLARLAFVSVCIQKRWATILLPSDDICWGCCKKYISGSDDVTSSRAQTGLIT